MRLPIVAPVRPRMVSTRNREDTKAVSRRSLCKGGLAFTLHAEEVLYGGTSQEQRHQIYQTDAPGGGWLLTAAF